MMMRTTNLKEEKENKMAMIEKEVEAKEEYFTIFMLLLF
jgi:hypothetical protein